LCLQQQTRLITQTNTKLKITSSHGSLVHA
jgi:hypothetical protein